MMSEIQALRKLPIGTANFREIITNNLVFVDKSLLIKALLDSPDKVTLITRPRRWGKTLNFSMLCHFLAREVNGQATAGLFNHLHIAQAEIPQTSETYLHKYQGQFPVVAMSFKDVMGNNLADALAKIYGTIVDAYKQHEYLLDSDHLTQNDKKKVQATLDRFEDKNESDRKNHFGNAVKELSTLLEKHHGCKCYILMDEYDIPLNTAYQKGYLTNLTDFMRDFFSATFKDNDALEKGVMTGVLRISKNSMLSGLNNLKVYSVLEDTYSPYFGFTEAEIQDILPQCNVHQVKLDDIKAWYNGYQIGDSLVFNPWSIMECLHPHNQGQLKNYWIGTGSTELIGQVLINGATQTLQQVKQLMDPQGGIITKTINPNITYEDLMRTNDNHNVWTLLLFSGYLTATRVQFDGADYQCDLKIPNREIAGSYRKIFRGWLEQTVGQDVYPKFMQNLLVGEVDKFGELLQQVFVKTDSFHNIKTEKDFQGTLLLALGIVLHDTHYVQSNLEAGWGRFDLLIAPRDQTQSLGIIIELKVLKDEEFTERTKDHIIDRQLLATKLAREGLRQIDRQGYDYGFETMPHVNEILKIGLVLHDRDLVWEENRTKSQEF